MELAELAKLVDEYDEANEERLEADREAKRLKKIESDMKERIIAVLLDQGVGFAAGQVIRVKLGVKSKPQAESWPDVWGYMKEHDAMDLVQKRFNESAINDRIEEGEEIPGLTFVQVYTLSKGRL